MSTQTPNFGLVKPAPEDFYDIADFNGNADTIDTALQDIKDTADAAVPAAEKGRPGGVAKTEHTHTKSQITDFPTALPADGGNSATVGGKTPADFAAAVHTHTKSQITDFPTALPADGGNAATVGGMAPTDFAKATHNHTKSQITDFSHTHPKSQITDFPSTMKNPYALTLQINGATNKTYDGGSAQTYNINTENLGLYKKLWSGTLNEGGSISASWINDWNGFIILTTQHKFITVDKRPGEYIKGLSGFALDKGLIQIIGLYLMISGTTLKYQAMQGMQCNLNTAQISKQAQSFPITTIYGINKPL